MRKADDMQIRLQARLVKYDGLEAIAFYFHDLVQTSLNDFIQEQHRNDSNAECLETINEVEQDSIDQQRTLESPSDKDTFAIGDNKVAKDRIVYSLVYPASAEDSLLLNNRKQHLR